MLVLLIAAFLLYKAFQLWASRAERGRGWWFGLATAGAALVALAIVVRGDIVASKCLALLAMPTGLVWVALALAAVLAWRERRPALAALVGGALLLYTLAGNAWVGAALVTSLERRIPPVDLATLAPFDAVFVLGGGTDVTAEGLPQFGQAGDRLALAAQLFVAGKTPRLVASGASLGGMEPERDLAAETAALWRGLGIPADAIIAMRPVARNTTQEVASYRDLIASHGWKRVGLISSAWHLPRALRLCERNGLEMVPLGADRDGRMPEPAAIWLIPQERGFRQVQTACWEYLGSWMGR
jgi:uncharacterized SAM-binding protein YcdF (DUF218 family)